MPKTKLVFVDQINFLTVAGTQTKLRAISYYRGGRGVFADAARDFIDAGIRNFIEGLSDKERKRFDEILDNLTMADSLKD